MRGAVWDFALRAYALGCGWGCAPGLHPPGMTSEVPELPSRPSEQALAFKYVKSRSGTVHVGAAKVLPKLMELAPIRSQGARPGSPSPPPRLAGAALGQDANLVPSVIPPKIDYPPPPAPSRRFFFSHWFYFALPVA